MRLARILPALLATLLGCSDTNGPGLDGPEFINLTVNGATWHLDNLVTFQSEGPRMSFNGQRVVHETGRTYVFQLDLDPFIGRGTYSIGDVGPLQQADIAVEGAFPTYWYLSDSSHPGTLTAREIRTTDSTMVGDLSMTLYRSDDHATTLDVTGEFRVRYR